MGKTKTSSKGQVPSEFVNVNFTVPYGLLAVFDQETQKRGYTRSEGLRQAMRRLLEVWTGARY